MGADTKAPAGIAAAAAIAQLPTTIASVTVRRGGRMASGGRMARMARGSSPSGSLGGGFDPRGLVIVGTRECSRLMKSEPPPCPNTTTNGSTSANDGASRTLPSTEPTWTIPARGGDCVQTKCGAALSACGAHKDTGGQAHRCGPARQRSAGHARRQVAELLRAERADGELDVQRRRYRGALHEGVGVRLGHRRGWQAPDRRPEPVGFSRDGDMLQSS